MEITTFFNFIVGAAVGWFIAQILLLFFQNEIFAFMDRLIGRVRRACRLDEDV